MNFLVTHSPLTSVVLVFLLESSFSHCYFYPFPAACSRSSYFSSLVRCPFESFPWYSNTTLTVFFLFHLLLIFHVHCIPVLGRIGYPYMMFRIRPALQPLVFPLYFFMIRPYNLHIDEFRYFKLQKYIIMCFLLAVGNFRALL